MSISSNLRVDDSAKDESIDIPQAQSDNLKNQGNYILSGSLKKVNSVDIGKEAAEFFNITSGPLSAEGKIFVSDGANKVTAFGAKLKPVWSTQILSNDDSGQDLPGGIAYKNGKIFVTTGFGKVAAINSTDGKILWEKQLTSPIRSAPAVDSGESADKVFVTTADNKTFALSSKNGEIIWRHSSTSERTRKFAQASPVVKNKVAAVSYASGEVFGISTTQGREIWGELLSVGLSQTKAASGLNDVAVSPIIVDGILYATSAGGKLAAINFTNGARIWEKSISGMASPWVAGRYIFIINEGEELVALNRFDGRVKWIKPLRSDEQKADKKHVRWSGPIMGNGNLITHNNSGDMVIIDANTGNTVSRREIADDVYSAAAIINGKMYAVSNDAELIEME